MKLQTFVSRISNILRGLSSQTLSYPPPGRSRRVTSFLIAGYLLWQLGLPLAYYAGEDESDERFAWRMFSAVNYLQKTCIVSLGEWRSPRDLRPLLEKEFLEAVPVGWMRFLHRDRAKVIDKFLRRHCQANPALSAVEILRKCQAANGSGKTLDSFKMSCLTGEIRKTRDIL